MTKVSELHKKLIEAKKNTKSLKEKEFVLIDKLHNAIIEEIMKSGLLTKMQWYIPHCKYNYIDQIDAVKDDTWNKIVKMLEKSEKISWGTKAVSLNDDVVLDIEGGIISLLP